MPTFDTAANIISQAAKEMGLITASITDPYASTNGNILQMCALLDSLGRDLAGAFPWSHLVKEYTFSTVAATDNYALPSDFGALIDQSGHDRTNQIDLGGPISSQQWQLLKGTATTVNFTLLFRPWKQKVYFAAGTSTPGSHTVAYEYVSTWWVKETGQSAANTDTADTNTDTLWIDRQLIIKGLKKVFLEAKGFPSDSARADFETMLQRAKEADVAAPALPLASLSGSLPGFNVPETGLGS